MLPRNDESRQCCCRQIPRFQPSSARPQNNPGKIVNLCRLSLSLALHYYRDTVTENYAISRIVVIFSDVCHNVAVPTSLYFPRSIESRLCYSIYQPTDCIEASRANPRFHVATIFLRGSFSLALSLSSSYTGGDLFACPCCRAIRSMIIIDKLDFYIFSHRASSSTSCDRNPGNYICACGIFISLKILSIYISTR